MKSLRYVLFALVLCFCITPRSSYAADGLFTAVTNDGIELKMKRYRPTPEADFNEGRQTILLFSGIVCNMNEFLTHTPPDRKDDYKNMKLPEPIAEWAVGDVYIEADPMRYYSLAHYLWLKGYDPWFANYRGTGRGEFKSEKGSHLTTLDVWAVLDAPACIAKVYEETGVHPVIGGHSTGGLVSYCYLQGTYMDHEKLGNGYIPHVQSNMELAEKRNSEVKGFIALDPAAIPPLPSYMGYLNIAWYSLGLPLYIDLDGFVDNVVNPMIKDSGIIIAGVSTVFGMISGGHNLFDYVLGGYLPPQMDILGYLNFWQVDNTHPNVEDFFARYGCSSTFLRAISQYFDLGMNQALREHWKNGEENRKKLRGPDPKPGEDGYYYYGENMHLMRVPAITFLSYYSSLVDSEQIIEDLMNKKTSHEYDEYYIVPESSHVDVPVGYNAPTFSFPKIGAWLEKVCEKDQSDTEEEILAVDPETDALADDNGKKRSSDSDNDSCFILTSKKG